MLFCITQRQLVVQNLYIRTNDSEVRITTNLHADTKCRVNSTLRNQLNKKCTPVVHFFIFFSTPPPSPRLFSLLPKIKHTYKIKSSTKWIYDEKVIFDFRITDFNKCIGR